VSEYHYGVKTKLHDNGCLEQQLGVLSDVLAIQLVFENQLQSAWRVLSLKGRPFTIPNELRSQLNQLLLQQQPVVQEANNNNHQIQQPQPQPQPQQNLVLIQQLQRKLQLTQELLQLEEDEEPKQQLLRRQQDLTNQLLNVLYPPIASETVAVRLIYNPKM